MKNIGVILSGGNGNRFNSNLPKQFLKVAGKSVIEHTINIFEKHPLIDEICIVTSPNYVYKTEEIVLRNKFKKVKKILNGGKERYQSTLSAINAYEDNVNLIFHDAVRPLLGSLTISDIICFLGNYNAIDVAIPSSDTIIEINDSNEIVNIPDRNKLRRGQTPQAFKRNTIKKAYDIALQDPMFTTTDDCGVVKKYLPEEKIYVVEGEQKNMKLTYKEDLFLLDKLFQLQSIDFATELDNDEQSQLNKKVLVVFGGSRGIGKSICDLARSYNMNVYSFSRSLNNVDITKVEDVRKALESVYLKEKSIDYIVNSAAVLEKVPINSMDYASIHLLIDLNLKGMVIVAKESHQYLEQSRGHLINFTSSSYTRGRALYSIYSCTKAAAVNFTQALAEEWENDYIKVNCINPERTKTSMRIKNFGDEPDNTLLNPSEVALKTLKTITTKITGQIIDVKLRMNE